MERKIFSTEFAGRHLEIEVGELAQFANGSVLVRYGDTVVLTTATSSEPREGIDFFPLSVDYEEKMYAIGKIPGGFLRREGRPTEKATLTARMLDRQIRPFFPDGFRNDVTVNNLVLSVDKDNSPEVAAMIGTNLALAISDIPFEGPLAGVQMGMIDGEPILCPTWEEVEQSDLHLTVAGSLTKVCMIEAGGNEIPEDLMMEAIIEAHEAVKQLIHFFEEIVAEVGKEKFTFESGDLNAEVYQAIKDQFYQEIVDGMQEADKAVRDANVRAVSDKIAPVLEENYPDEVARLGEIVDNLQKDAVRDLLYNQHKRVDGRGLHEIRPLDARVAVLPRTHGSAYFRRGQTQVLSIATLGTLSNAQMLDSIDPVTEKRYMHQYNFPGYSVGESKPSRSPGRREIGHGALAEKALLPVIPSAEEFPYAIRVVSEVTMSNGSTSQASICGSTLSLMDAGVPIKRPVAGISSGLISHADNDDDYLVFMDIQGIEDFYGDMDFKVGGTSEGITAIQVDIKNKGLTYNMIRDALEITREGRMQIINECLLPAIAEPRDELSPYAPKIESIDIPADKIREIIGSGGKNIKRITDESGCEIDIQEEGAVGHVFIAAPDAASAEVAMRLIRTIAYDPEPGEIFDATVTRLMTFGAFVEYAPGKEGLVHISKLSWDHVDKVEDVVEPGQKVRVIVTDIDSQGRINLSMRDLLPKPGNYDSQARRPERNYERRQDDRYDSRSDDRRRGRGYDDRRDERSDDRRNNYRRNDRSDDGRRDNRGNDNRRENRYNNRRDDRRSSRNNYDDSDINVRDF